MLKPLYILVVVALLGRGHADGQSYGGPNVLGPFRIDKDVSMSTLFERLGRPSKVANDVFCYKSKDDWAFLVVTRMAEVYDAKVAGDVLLSSFCNCIDRPAQVTPNDLLAWKTEKGIGLGARVEGVRKAYGPPSKEDKIEGTGYRWVIHGDFRDNHYTTEKRPEIGDTVLVYQGTADDSRTAEFGIRQRKVVWIFLSKNE